jgi:diacylglycerol kinase (ATP)
MQATLIYNPNAGSISQLPPDKILEALKQAGYDPIYAPTLQEDDLEDVLKEAKDVVVVCGGDGSIRSAAIRLLGRDVRIVPLPMGTANNICRMLELNVRPLDIIAGLSDPVERDIDFWEVTTPHGRDYFIEALGFGGGADAMEKYDPEKGKSVLRGIHTLLQTLNGYQPKFFHINVDGQDFSGSYFLCEVMNTPTVGHHFMLAPEAKPDDGLFDLILVHASQHFGYLKFAKAIFTRSVGSMPEVSVCRGRKLEIAWRGFPLHLDGTVIAGLDGVNVLSSSNYRDQPELLDVAKPFIRVELASHAVHFLVPREAALVEKYLSAAS